MHATFYDAHSQPTALRFLSPSPIEEYFDEHVKIMESQIQNLIIDYFSLFEEFYSFAKSSLKDCQKCAISINKLVIRCRYIEEANLNNTQLQQFDRLQSRLLASLHNLISVEVQDIRIQLSSIEDFLEKVYTKYKLLQETCRFVKHTDQTPLVQGTPLQPPLKTLLEFAEETLTFGAQLCAQIETSLSVLELKGLNTPPLAENFKILHQWHLRIPEIIAYTSFCSENQKLI